MKHSKCEERELNVQNMLAKNSGLTFTFGSPETVSAGTFRRLWRKTELQEFTVNMAKLLMQGINIKLIVWTCISVCVHPYTHENSVKTARSRLSACVPLTNTAPLPGVSTRGHHETTILTQSAGPRFQCCSSIQGACGSFSVSCDALFFKQLR